MRLPVSVVSGIVGGFAALCLLLTPAAAQDKPLKKIRYATGSTVVNIAYPWMRMPLALKYWRDAGYDVEIVPLGGALQAIQQMVAGNVDIVQLNSTNLVQGNVSNGLQMRALMLNTVNDWSLGVPADSPIKTVRDFKGKTIGVPNLATGGMPLLRLYLQQNGLDPDNDVSIVPIGFGPQALQAVRSGRVQGAMFFQAAFASFENLGVPFRYFHAADWRQQPDFAMATLQKTIDADPAMIKAIVKGAVEATVFAMANPDCVRKLQWANWPDTKPSGAPDEATQIKWDLNNLHAQETSMQEAFELSGGKNWGAYTVDEMDRLQSFMLQTKMIDKRLPNASYIVNIPGFFDAVNAFDHAAVVHQAETCTMN